MSGIEDLNSSPSNSDIEYDQEENSVSNRSVNEANVPLPPSPQSPWGDTPAGVSNFLGGIGQDLGNASEVHLGESSGRTAVGDGSSTSASAAHSGEASRHGEASESSSGGRSAQQSGASSVPSRASAFKDFTDEDGQQVTLPGGPLTYSGAAESFLHSVHPNLTQEQGHTLLDQYQQAHENGDLSENSYRVLSEAVARKLGFDVRD